MLSEVVYTDLSRAGQGRVWGREERNMEGISQPHPTPNICLLFSPLLPRPGAKAKQTLALGLTGVRKGPPKRDKETES